MLGPGVTSGIFAPIPAYSLSTPFNYPQLDAEVDRNVVIMTANETTVLVSSSPSSLYHLFFFFSSCDSRSSFVSQRSWRFKHCESHCPVGSRSVLRNAPMSSSSLPRNQVRSINLEFCAIVFLYARKEISFSPVRLDKSISRLHPRPITLLEWQ